MVDGLNSAGKFPLLNISGHLQPLIKYIEDFNQREGKRPLIKKRFNIDLKKY